jgi:DNA-binding CsgD family transcriptional regulator
LPGPVARAIRASLRLDAAQRAGREAPGLILLDPHDGVELITDPARELLAAIRCDTQAGSDNALPSAVVALARGARAGDVQTVTVPSELGWMTLHASLPDGPTDGRVAIVIERATGAQLAALRLDVHGVTPREREVATLLSRGLSNLDIAAALVVSPHTVEDHLSSLFEKLGVASRQELVARVFLDEYLPAVMLRTPLTADGRFDRGASTVPA